MKVRVMKKIYIMVIKVIMQMKIRTNFISIMLINNKNIDINNDNKKNHDNYNVHDNINNNRDLNDHHIYNI